MELRIWVDEMPRVVCGVSLSTTCQEIVVALAQAINKTGRFILVEKWRDNERLVAPSECPLLRLQQLGELGREIIFTLSYIDNDASLTELNKQSGIKDHLNSSPHSTVSDFPKVNIGNYSPRIAGSSGHSPVNTSRPHSASLVRKSLTFSGARSNSRLPNSNSKTTAIHSCSNNIGLSADSDSTASTDSQRMPTTSHNHVGSSKKLPTYEEALKLHTRSFSDNLRDSDSGSQSSFAHSPRPKGRTDLMRLIKSQLKTLQSLESRLDQTDKGEVSQLTFFTGVPYLKETQALTQQLVPVATSTDPEVQRYDDLSRDLSDLEFTATQLRSDMTSLWPDIAEKDKKLTTLTHHINQLSHRKAQIELACHSHDRKPNDIDSDLNDARKNVATKQATLYELEKQLHDLNLGALPTASDLTSSMMPSRVARKLPHAPLATAATTQKNPQGYWV